METIDLQYWRVIGSKIDIRLLISELASPDCTLQTLKLDIQNYGQLNRPLTLLSYEDASPHVISAVPLNRSFGPFIINDNSKIQLTNVLGKSKSLKALDISFCSDFLMVDKLCKLLQYNEVLESLKVCTVIADQMSQVVGMLEKNKTLKHLQIVNSSGNCWDLADLARVLQAHSTLEQLTVDSFWGRLQNIESIFEMLEGNTKMNRLDLRIGGGHGSWARHASSMLQKNCTLTALTILGAPGTRFGRETLSHVLSPFCGDATTGKQAHKIAAHCVRLRRGSGSCKYALHEPDNKGTNRGEKKHSRKELKEFEDDLTYWLQFIASNTPTSTTSLPQLLVILTHADRDLDGGLVEWAKHVVDELRERFQNIVHIFTDIYAVNARSSDHVIPVLDFVLKNSRYLLSRTQVFPECVAMRLLLSNRIRGHPNQPIISWSTFSELCNEILPEGMGESSQLDVVERKCKSLAAHLHHMGDIIYFQGLEFIVVNPGWFCHNIMGFVINFRGIQHMTDKGFATKEYMQHILKQSLSLAKKNILSGGWGIHLQPANLMHLMLKLNICYEKDPGNLDAGIFIPAILDANFSATERAAIAEGKRKLVWPIPTSQAPVKAIFVGRRLECNNPFQTFLTPGFFPRLQVVLHNTFYSNDSLSKDYKLDKGSIILNFKGIEVLVESSGDVGYYIDVLVRSSLSHSETLKIIDEDILKTIYKYSASSDGCRGVWLVESILRPKCVQELTLLKYRKDQAMATEALKQELLMVGCNMNHKYTWKVVIEKGANNSDSPIVVLGSGHDLAVELLGEQGTTNFMEWRWSELEEVSFKLNDVKAPTEILDEDEETAVPSDVFHVTAPLRHTLSGYHEATMENMERGFNLLLQHQEAVGDRIIASFKEDCAKMKMAERELQHELCNKVDALMEFTVQLQQRNIPRLAYCVRKEGMISFGKLVTCFIPGLHSSQLHLMCEHIDGIHDVEGQKGFEVTLESETFHKIRPLLDKGLQILSILLKVGAQLTTGLASQVPMLKVGSGILGGAATVIPAQLPTMTGCDDASVSRLVGKEVAEKWLVDTMKQVPDIAETFDLHKVVYTG